MRARASFACASLVAALALSPAHARAGDAKGREPAADAKGGESARERSREAFMRGVSQLRSEDWAGARASFERAWALYPHPSILLNLGLAHLKTGDPVLAERDLVRFLSDDGGASPEEIRGARDVLAEARSKIGTVRVVASPQSARIAVDGALAPLVRPAPGSTSDGRAVVAEVRATAGPHEVVVSADGYAGQQRTVSVVAQRDADVRIVLAPLDAPRERGPSTRAVVGWSLAGLSVAALAVGGVAGLRAKSLSDDYVDRGNARFQDPDVRSEGIAFRTGADVALGVAIVSGAAAAVLLLTRLGEPDGAPGAASAAPAVLRW